MTKEEFLKLQVGLYITDCKDVDDPSNYCRIEAFDGTKIQLRHYEYYDHPAASPFRIDYKKIDITQKLFNSEYYALSRR